MNQFIGEMRFLLPIKNIVSKYSSSVFLFSGIEGIGKRKIASIICNNLLHLDKTYWEKGNNLFTNNQNLYDKKSYNLFKNNTHPDLFIIENDEEGIIPIEITRSLKKFLNSTSGISQNKVVIIDPIEKLSLNSINMILKSLEEPPERTFIFIISHNSSKIIETVKSRVFKFNFRTLNKENLLEVFSANKIQNINYDHLTYLGTFFNNSPGLITKFYNENFFENYENLIKFFINTSQSNNNIYSYKFISSKNKKIDENLLILFINKIFKLLLIHNLSDLNCDNLSKLEIKLSTQLKSGFFVNNFYDKYTKFQKDLFEAEKLNVNKNDIIDNFLISFNF